MLGITGKAQVLVTRETLASRVGSGAVEVFSTPNLVLLMEEAAAGAVEEYLEPGETTVGTALNIRHLSATPEGLAVTATARLTEIDGRRLVFCVEAHDGIEKIGEGTHDGFVISKEKFLRKVYGKSR